MRIDSHHHFWRYSAAEYGWIGDSMERLRRDFLPADLKPELDAAGVDGVVSVQARQSLAESESLLAFARENDWIYGVVGWAPLTDQAVWRTLERLAQNPKLRGVRHVVQDEPDDRYLLRDDFNRGVALLEELGLVYDILIFEKHLPYAVQFVDRHPKITFVLDHIAKPRIADGLLAPWQSWLVELARRPNVYCKVSGMATEADWKNWSPETLEPYFTTALEAFGPRRLMFGSDWPVCLLAVQYQRWVEIVERWTASLSATERERFWGGTAAEAYGLKAA